MLNMVFYLLNLTTANITKQNSTVVDKHKRTVGAKPTDCRKVPVPLPYSMKPTGTGKSRPNIVRRTHIWI
jgi:hypothetical protein